MLFVITHLKKRNLLVTTIVQLLFTYLNFSINKVSNKDIVDNTTPGLVAFSIKKKKTHKPKS